jgi:dTDP-4-dehydrorhamnose 3,5-epimerase
VVKSIVQKLGSNTKKFNVLGVRNLDIVEHFDSRGSFTEVISKRLLLNHQLGFFEFAQLNFSVSQKNTFRGIHFSKSARPQHKLVMCLEGSISDFIVDIRIGSPTYGKVDRFELSSKAREVIFIPSGCGHGFLAREDKSVVLYAQSSEYSPSEEFEISALDQSLRLNIEDIDDLILSQKDRAAPNLEALRSDNFLPLYKPLDLSENKLYE